ncbi:DUF4870 domain-containing protein [Cellulomonas fengjieae]|uniref:DUF4870 domain-containing protein n=1 Tax=Cellulomonas fengjieae TaxID=2819978 RepID=A0ABS3SE16_9CELL|nr:DUF4870 domain-containing protein [Cellulomonas fengjieae]MBO3083994.1 DUF4870 domain-containing protein [Cellulomonas fengjieae]MBO3101255.1 DUF4870 domain-containing protein [Cellulomonas fengjieae]QVI64740.1 DUF4870 domain-containing protein [Cellulomonas fengjieae]
MTAPWTGPVYGPPPLRPDEERNWAMLAHLLALLGGWVAPLVILLAFRGRGRYVEDQAKESLNFQLTLLLAVVAVVAVTLATFGLAALVLVPVLGLVQLVFPILGGVAASRFEWYRYPVSLRMVS